MISLIRIRIFIYLTIICTTLFAQTTDRRKYSSKYDNIDVDEILDNSRLRNQYVKCLINTAPCVTGAARFLKETFGDAVITKCDRCTEKQVDMFNKITEWFTTNEPDTWNRAVQISLEELRKKSN